MSCSGSTSQSGALAARWRRWRLGRRVAADLHLHAAKAARSIALGLGGEVVDRFALLVEAAAGIGLDPIAAAAEQAVERHPRHLAGDVPQRDVDAADPIHDDAAPAELAGAGEHLLPQPLDQQRVLAEQHRAEQIVDDVPGAAAADAGLADAGDAIIGLDLDQEAAARRLHAAGAAIGRFAAIGERDRADIGDLHRLSPHPARPSGRTGSASAPPDRARSWCGAPAAKRGRGTSPPNGGSRSRAGSGRRSTHSS